MGKKKHRDATVYNKGYLDGIVYTAGKSKDIVPYSKPGKPNRLWLYISAPFVYVAKLFTMKRNNSYALVPETMAMPGVRTKIQSSSLRKKLQIKDAVGAPKKNTGGILVRVAAIALCALMGGTALWGMAMAPAGKTPVQVSVIDGGEEFKFLSAAETVGELLSEFSIELREGDILSHEGSALLEGGMTITIERANTVYVWAHDDMRKLYLHEGTVEDALSQAQVDLCEADEVNVPLTTPLNNGMFIEVTSLEQTELVETEEIGFLIEKEYDDTLPKDDEVKDREGENGLKEYRYRVTVRDGIELERELLEETVVKEPVNRLVRVGTGKNVRYQTSLTGDRRLFRPRPKGDEIRERLYMEVTAYTHTGRRTATGTRPKIGTIAVNPDQIPYGTKLYVVGYGYGVAEDTGAFRHTDRTQIDLFMNTEEECLKWGRKRKVRVYILN